MLSQSELTQALDDVLEGVSLSGFGDKINGKVRDIYQHGDERILITTDRVSAFDSILGLIPYKGQVLNQLSAWWFGQTQALVPNHMVATPDVNIMIGREAQALPVEVVVRGYITGVTSTSMWTLYEAGERQPYGILLPDGLQKNDRLPQPVITPTTKAQDGAHDERITPVEIVERGLIEADLWRQIESVALELFALGQKVANEAGLILVDTKYEFGLIDGELALIDEIHTPDSSRYWTWDSYHAVGGPKHYDKEHLRHWFAAHGYKGEGAPPKMPPKFQIEMAQLYIRVYEMLTGSDFRPGSLPAALRIKNALNDYYEVE